MLYTLQNHVNIFLLFFIFLFSFFLFCVKTDAPERWQLNFQDPATPVAEGIITLHHDIMFLLTVVLFFVCWLLFRTLWIFHEKNSSTAYPLIHGTQIEVFWTITPSLALIVIAIPSFALLYSLDEIIDPTITVKAIGNQWYWTYEYADYSDNKGSVINYDSYMIPTEDLELGQLRLLETDNHMVIPVNTHIRLIVSAADVLHSYAVPSLGVKVDAVPGRLNQTSLFIKREGLYYGQCSEICGVNHATMPIVIEAVPLSKYISWVSNKIEE
uniref:Cytochrome c oxidase subunit 2 n=1 Tax=Compsopogon caeruleus TaxID=31354 RepID=A0A1Z1XBF3_9RHOD|nr:cytochrome c oxidase subunit 2 [Compsopogon caeruleus]ARX96194.1 cytochrome c oxidase subunit 2 [Compsopogon caeruleus]